MSEPTINMINLQSGVSAYTGEPFVEIHWGDKHGQFTPEEARAHAVSIEECADAAISDAFLWKFMREKVGASEENAARALVAFREYREGRQPPAEIPDAER